MTEAQLSVVVGVLVSMGLQLLKRVWPALDNSEALVKQVSAVVLAAVVVLAAAQWRLDAQTAWGMALAAISALGTHRALLKTPEPCEVKP